MNSFRLLLSYIPGSLLGPLMSVASAAVFTRGMSPGEYGTFTMVTTGATLASVCLAQWLSQALLRFLPAASTPGEAADIKATAAGVALYLALGCALLAAALLPVGGVYAAAALFAGATSVLTIYAALLQAQLKGKEHSLLMGLSALLKFAVPAALLLLLHSVSAMVLGAAAGVALAIACAAPRSRRLISGAQLSPDRKLLESFCRYGIPMIGWLFVGNLLILSDRYLIGIFCSTADVGIYSANYTLAAGGVSFLGGPVSLVLHPKLMQARNCPGSETAIWLGRIIWALVAVTLLGTAFLSFWGEGIVRLLLSREFLAGYRVVPVVFLASMILQLGLYLHKPFEFRGKTAEMFLYIVLAAGVNIGLNIVLLPRYGYYVASWTTVAGALVYAVLCGVRARNEIHWGRPRLGPLLPMLKGVLHGRG